MNRILHISGLLLLLTGCNSINNDLQQNWIGKYTIHQANSKDESISRGKRQILKFENDSLRIKNFYFDFILDTNDTRTSAYHLEDDLLFISSKGQSDTLKIELTKDSFVLNYLDSYPIKAVFEKLPAYQLASRELELYNFLISSSFKMLDSVRVEFKDDGELILPNFDFLLGDNQFWMIDKYDEELFLVIDGIWGFVLHISELDSDYFKGTIYGHKDKQVVFKRLLNESKFNIKDLQGEWIELSDENNPPPPPPPILDEKRAFFEKEHLHFNNSILIKKSFFRVDTIEWETNREQDLILFPELNVPILQKKWKIISLSHDKLTIERTTRIRNENGNQVERIVFEKNKSSKG
jgi:hypothetical protein